MLIDKTKNDTTEFKQEATALITEKVFQFQRPQIFCGTPLRSLSAKL